MNSLLIHSLFSSAADIYFKSQNKNTYFASLRTRAHTCSMTGQIPPNHRPCAGRQLNLRLQNSFRNIFQSRQTFKQRWVNVKWHTQPVNTFPTHLQNLLDLFLKASFVCFLCPMTHTQGSQSHRVCNSAHSRNFSNHTNLIPFHSKRRTAQIGWAW